MRHEPDFLTYTNILQPFIETPKETVEKILVIHNIFTNPDPFGRTQIDFLCIAKSLPRSKEIAFDLYEKLNERYNVILPTPQNLPQGKSLADLPPVALRVIQGKEIRLIGQVLNGEYRYNASFIIS
ncbi:hypothetical protein CH379_017975 [Leptospira ellisii]|uniref:Uncharacterized protein n=1 Tax=Leptospira ellisii TaxID=2023197 RepID=A0A2N0BP26_9LEPT|nr:hypothetical protein [Leptospira ellisii]MDV6237524.1 hypothetical protein [Leptospira ellisii]PJZ92221.1 hypothetical protein CH379_14380 [Leptospira ellisii]PKA05723.1 hypothetical protein CH375_03595 [Leptospira ellisii]